MTLARSIYENDFLCLHFAICHLMFLEMSVIYLSGMGHGEEVFLRALKEVGT